ncbi:MAG: 50S ribosomal protein L18 [Ignavibacteriales bacterium]|jgi:large subunit ribosomal protein L18|nr:50S ribosomal protein L18 [Ignavibacteriales bacterium]
MIQKNTVERLAKKQARIRKKIKGTSGRPRLVVFRSAKHAYAQIIDDSTGKTLLSVSTLSKDLREDVKQAKTPIERYKLIGVAAAKKALEKNIKEVVFDRSGYLYHGRVKALADGAREGGLKF